MALGAYQSEVGRGNVLNALAHPATVNPLAAIQGAAQTYGAVMDARKLQAQQAIGGILQQATDAQGNVDYGKANALAAQAGPGVQMGMATMLQNNSQLLGQQQQNAMRHMSLVGGAALTLMNDPSDAGLAKVRTSLLNSGVPQAVVDQEIGTMQGMSPQDRQQYAYAHGIAAMNPDTAMTRVGGQTTILDTGSGQIPYTINQPRPGQPGYGTVGPGGVATTLTPGQAATQVEFDANQDYVKTHPGVTLGQKIKRPLGDVVREQGGILPPGAVVTLGTGGGGAGGGGGVDSSGKPVGANNPPRLLKVPGQDGQGGGSTANVPPPPPGGTGGPYTGGGIGAAVNPPGAPTSLPVPPVPPQAAPPAPTPAPAPDIRTSPTLRGPGAPVPAAPSPPVAGVNSPRDSMTPGPQSSLGGGVPVASANGLAPTLGPAAPPSALVPGDVNAILQGMQGRQGVPSTGIRTAGDVAVGPGVQEASENKQSADLLTAHDTAAATYPQTVFPYAQALAAYGRGVTTAPGADFSNMVRGFANGVARSMNLPQPTSDTSAMDTLHKYLTQIISSNPVAAGSDARLAAVLAGNANIGIHELAGADVVKAGVALQRLTVALDQGWHALSPQQQAQYGGSYLNYLRDQASKVDIRALARDLYNPDQIKTLKADLQNGSEADAQRYLDTLQMARNANLLGTGKAMP